MPVPSHWPPNVHYISAPCYHSSVSQSTRVFLTQGAKSAPAGKKSSTNYAAVIRPISTSTHPACGQFGLFAARKIPAKTHIIDYIGEIHCDEREDSNYDLSLFRDGELSVGIDASAKGNEARFVNDYRGIQDKPNAVFLDGRTSSGELRMNVWSSRSIKKGEEILVSYGKAWWKARR
ncbi:SET domain protein [Mycena sp. CBHHK59/15]|nr:SET domain protein [Mycena sp. CBHHK59/15]